MYIGPNIVTDGLAFGYDSYHGGVQGAATRFYKGEPTSNLIPSSEHNGRFTTSNSWATYNTNQYNSNNDFDIGTIGSISNNIVTLSSVGHNIRSFDVLNPATTGGGVTAGTNYVVKKLSTTTFSLHAYNSSQNGSQGYINPSTNFFKVHDAYANDTRVSISASGFPDMWHGAPHLPNSGLIKEIVPNGGYVKGTNSMRLHVYRGDGVVDGMAYNVYPSVTQGDVITVSYWVKPTNANAYGKNWNYQTYFGGNAASSFNTALNSTGDWQHVVHQWTASVSYNFYSYWFPDGSTDKYAFDMADLQVEVNKSHATPFVAGTRSAINCLVDLKRTANINMNTMSFDSTGQPEFDGTDDRITMGDTSFTDFGTSDFTIEAVLYIPSNITKNTGHYKGVVVKKGAGGSDAGMGIYYNTGHEKFLWSTANGSSGVERFTVNSFGSLLGTYVHVVMVRDSNATNNGHFYINGVQEAITSGGSLMNVNNNYDLVVGASSTLYSAYFLEGKVPVAKIHNKALTAAEALQNFNAYKNRFNI